MALVVLMEVSLVSCSLFLFFLAHIFLLQLICSSLKKLAEKGCWDVAEAKTKGNRQLLEYVVSLK